MMDDKGNITLEIGIALIVILMVFGAVLSISEMSTQKALKQSENEHIETLIEGAVDNLINSPGEPNDWEVYNRGTPGLAIVNEEGQTVANSVSYGKLTALASNYDKLVNKKLFDSKVKTSMELIPHKSTISSVKVGESESSDNIHSVSRLVKCDFFKRYVLKDFQNEGKCNRNHDQDDYSCNYFKIFKGNLRKADYYLLVEDSEKYDVKYIVDTTRVVKQKTWQSLISNRVYLNDEISFYDDTSAVAFIHLDKKDAKALLVSVPKTFDKNYLNYDYFTASECEFILKAWY